MVAPGLQICRRSVSVAEAISNDDLILDILLTIRSDQQAPVSERLVREIYALQKLHQFEAERDKVVLGTKRAVEAEVDMEGRDLP